MYRVRNCTATKCFFSISNKMYLPKLVVCRNVWQSHLPKEDRCTPKAYHMWQRRVRPRLVDECDITFLLIPSHVPILYQKFSKWHLEFVALSLMHPKCLSHVIKRSALPPLTVPCTPNAYLHLFGVRCSHVMLVWLGGGYIDIST